MAPRIRDNDPSRRLDHRPDLTPRRTEHRPTRTDAPSDAGRVGEAAPRWLSRSAYAERAPTASEEGSAAREGARGPHVAHIGARGVTGTGAGAAGTTGSTGARRAGIGGSASARPSDGPEAGGDAATRARAIIDQAMAKGVSDSDSDDFVRNNVTAEVLQHATPAEKAHMLRCLMDGYTGSDDEAAMARILESVTTPDEMRAVLQGAGGAEAVWDELEGQRDAVANHFAAMGDDGARVLIDISNAMSTSSSLSDDFVRNHIDANVLQHASNEEKSRMLRHLMEGPTCAEDEAAMARVLASVSTPDDMMEVIGGAGGSEAVFDELEGSQGDFLRHLESLGADGDQILARMAADYSVSSSSSDDFVRDHVDADVLAQATPEQKAHMLRALMDGPTGGDDEAAMRRILNSAADRAELETILTGAGGADAVWDELEGQQSGFVGDLRARGAQGEEMILGLALSMSVSDSDTDDFIRNHVDANVLSHASVAEKGQLVERLRDGNYSAEDQEAVRTILRSAANPVELMDIAEAGGGLQAVLGLDAAQRQLVTDAYNANPGDAAFTQNLENLITDPNFARLSSDQKTAVLSQAGNYPDARSVANLQRLAGKDWFRSMSLEDTQRSAAMIAFVSQHPGDRTIIDNTLDRFLAPDASYSFDWEETGTPYGSAGTDDFHFNRAYLPAGNGPVDTTNDDTMHMVTHTVAHEVNHLVNNDRVAQTFDYFMEEYRAFYVGFRAEHGRDPTRDEVIDRVRGLITANSGAYDNIRQALADPTEGPNFLPFLRQVLGRNDVTQANAGTIGVVNGGATAPAPTDGGDMDN